MHNIGECTIMEGPSDGTTFVVDIRGGNRRKNSLV